MATTPHKSTGTSVRVLAARDPATRWECHCQEPPVLLATWHPGGRINIKMRDRYWHFEGFGKVQAVCPKCASQHELDLGRPVSHPNPEKDPGT